MIELKGLKNLFVFLQNQSHGKAITLHKNSSTISQASVAILMRLTNSPQQITLERVKFSPLPKNSLACPKELQIIQDANRLELLRQLNSLINLPIESPIGLEFLLIQRSTREADIHSGQIALAGGQVDGYEENDLQAVLREVKEEIGLTLEDTTDYGYLGALPLNVFAYYKKSKKVMMSVHLFFEQVKSQKQMSKNGEKQLHLNPEEIADAFWVPMSRFIHPNSDNIYHKELHRMPSNVFVRNSKVSMRLLESLLFGNNFQYMRACHMKVHGNQELFGLTFYIIVYLLRAMYCTDRSLNSEESLDNMRKLLKLSSLYTFHHSPESAFKAWVLNRIYYRARLQQFEVK